MVKILCSTGLNGRPEVLFTKKAYRSCLYRIRISVFLLVSSAIVIRQCIFPIFFSGSRPRLTNECVGKISEAVNVILPEIIVFRRTAVFITFSSSSESEKYGIILLLLRGL